MKRYPNFDDKQTEVIKKHGAFFAFSIDQFEQQRKEGVEYTGHKSGMMIPIPNVTNLFNDLDDVVKDKYSWELENNSKKDIIWWELANYETQLTGIGSGSFEKAVLALSKYGFTREDVIKEYSDYFEHCINNDYF